jgi:hypothetical protein
VAQLIYGAVVVLVLIFEPRGLISLLRRLGGSLRRLVPQNPSADRPPVGG